MREGTETAIHFNVHKETPTPTTTREFWRILKKDETNPKKNVDNEAKIKLLKYKIARLPVEPKPKLAEKLKNKIEHLAEARKKQKVKGKTCQVVEGLS